MTAVLDQVIREQYVVFDTPVEGIVGDPKVAAEFAKLVNAACPAKQKADLAEVNHRLFTLRKRGAEKGGLPRLRRAYKGRKAK
jgi:hypothetical protein